MLPRFEVVRKAGLQAVWKLLTPRRIPHPFGEDRECYFLSFTQKLQYDVVNPNPERSQIRDVIPKLLECVLFHKVTKSDFLFCR